EARVVPSTSTTVTLASSLNPSSFSQSVTLTATVRDTSGNPLTAATGTVTFYEGTTVLDTETVSSATAAFITSALAVGSHDVTTSYSGDTNYDASDSDALTQVVNKVNTTTLLTPSANGLAPNQAVTFAAVVNGALTGAGMPTGTVTFYN